MLIYKRACNNGVRWIDWPIALPRINAICTPLIGSAWGWYTLAYAQVFPPPLHRRIARSNRFSFRSVRLHRPSRMGHGPRLCVPHYFPRQKKKRGFPTFVYALSIAFMEV